MEESVESARKLKEMADLLGRQVFDQMVKVMDDLVEKGMGHDCAQSIVMEALVSVLGSFFAYPASGGNEAAAEEIAQDIMKKLDGLIKEEHLRYGASIVEIDLKRKEEP